MSFSKSLSERWNEFQPSKTLWFWTCAGCVAGTVLLGFTAGGWVTGGSARLAADAAAEEATTELVAAICVERFMAGPSVGAELAALKEADSWDRDELIVDGGWANVVGFEEPFTEAADACADQLAEVSLPAAEDAVTTPVVDQTAPIDG